MEKAQNPNSTQNQKSNPNSNKRNKSKRRILLFYGGSVYIGKVSDIFVKDIDNSEELKKVMDKFEVYYDSHDLIIPLKDYINVKFGEVPVISVKYDHNGSWLKLFTVICDKDSNECNIAHVWFKAYK